MLKKKLVLLLTLTLTSGIHKQPHTHCVFELNDKHNCTDTELCECTHSQPKYTQIWLNSAKGLLWPIKACHACTLKPCQSHACREQPHANTLQTTHRHTRDAHTQQCGSLLSSNRQTPRDAQNTQVHIWKLRITPSASSLPRTPHLVFWMLITYSGQCPNLASSPLYQPDAHSTKTTEAPGCEGDTSPTFTLMFMPHWFASNLETTKKWESTCSFLKGNWCRTEIPPEGTCWVYLFSGEGKETSRAAGTSHAKS